MEKCKTDNFEEYKNKLFKNYKNYLEDFDGISANSKKSYVSYVKNAIKCFEEYFKKSYSLNKFDFALKVEHELDDICTLVKIYLYKIKTGKIKDKKMTAKRASDTLAAFNLFHGMLSKDNICKNDSKKSTLKKYMKAEGISLYDKKELIRNFTLRLMTQPRDYEHINYHPQLLNKIKGLGVKNMLQESLKKMEIYCLKVKCISNKLEKIEIELKKFNNMNNIIIEENFVYANFECERDSYILLTPNAEYTRFYPFKPTELKDISIDHKESQYGIIEEQYEKYPELGKLSKFILGKGNKAKLNSAYLKAGIVIPNLRAEIEMIISESKLVAMSRSENSAKGKKSTNN